MKAKYHEKQKVKIILVEDQHLHVKYPKIKQYVGETGVITGVEFTRIRNGGNMENYAPGDSYIYQVCLDSGVILKAVPEDALETLDE